MFYAMKEEQYGTELYGFRSVNDRAAWLGQNYARGLDYKEARALCRKLWRCNHPDTCAVHMVHVLDWYVTKNKYGEAITEFTLNGCDLVNVAIPGDHLFEINEIVSVYGPVLLPLRKMLARISEIRAPWSVIREQRENGQSEGIATVNACIEMYENRETPAAFGFEEDARHFIAEAYRAVNHQFDYFCNEPNAGNAIAPGVIYSIKNHDIMDECKARKQELERKARASAEHYLERRGRNIIDATPGGFVTTEDGRAGVSFVTVQVYETGEQPTLPNIQKREAEATKYLETHPGLTSKPRHYDTLTVRLCGNAAIMHLHEPEAVA